MNEAREALIVTKLQLMNARRSHTQEVTSQH